MVRDGYAWHYKEYASEQDAADRSRYGNAEALARSARSGLWADTSPMYPSDYRRGWFLARYHDPYTVVGSAAATQGINSWGTSATPNYGSGPIRVRSYTRSDGTYVHSYTRSSPRHH
jgi:hypothetical protein